MCDVGEWCPQILSLCGQGVMMLQECPRNLEVPGYVNFGHDMGKSCVLLPCDYEPSVTWCSSQVCEFAHFTFACCVVISGLAAISCYFPHKQHHDLFMVAMHEARCLLDKVRNMEVRTFVLGCNLNSQLPPNLYGCTGSTCYKSVSQDHLHRVDMAIALMQDFGLVVSNTFGGNSSRTIISWKKIDVNDASSVFKCSCQIDDLLASHAIATAPAVVFDSDRVWRSDRFPLRLHIQMAGRFTLKS